MFKKVLRLFKNWIIEFIDALNETDRTYNLR